MELIIGLLVIGVVGYFVFFRKKEEEISPAPYKVETPVSTYDVAPAAVVAEGAGTVEISAVPAAVVAETPAPVVAETPAKKPRKPRAPKAEKPAKEKAAKPKKAAAIKATKKSKKA